MSRLLTAVLVLTFIAAPSFAANEEGVLPDVIAQAINDAAGTGNPLVVGAVADQMGHAFPMLKAEIDTYVAQIAAPATSVMASAIEMAAEAPPVDQGFAMLFDTAPQAEEQETASLASDLNNMDIGDSIEQ